MTLTEKAPTQIEEAYYTFKGSKSAIGLSKANQILEVTQTARISSYDTNWVVTVYTDTTSKTVPPILKEAAEKHNLTEVKSEKNYDGSLYSVTFAPN